MFPIGIVAAVCTLTVASAPLLAQRTLDPGGLGSRDPGRQLERAARERGGAMMPTAVGILAAPEEQPEKYVWNVTPNVVTTRGQQAYGASLAFVNRGITPRIPFVASVSGKMIKSPTETHGRVQGNLEVDAPDGLLGKDGLTTAFLTGQYQYTRGVSNAQEVTLEVDRGLPWRVKNQTLTLAGIGYYDRSAPVTGEAAHGPTLGAALYWAATSRTGRHAVEADAEYDAYSEFNREDSFTARLVYADREHRLRPKLFVGFAKHDVWLGGLKVALR